MATPIYVNQSTTLVQVDTSIIQEHIVRLSSVNTPGSIITIRDITGNASSDNPITISTTQQVQFLDGGGLNNNIYRITQPYGFMTITPKTSTVWGVLNTYGFPDSSAAAIINNLTATSITVNNSYLNRAIISTALISTLSTDNVFVRGNISVGHSTIAHAGFYTCTLRSLDDMITSGTLYAGSTISSMFGNITSTLTVPYISTQNIEMYGVLRSASTISTMGPLFVGSSISTTGNLAVGGSTFIQGELKVLKNVTFHSSLSTLYSLGVGRETQLYSTLSVKDNIFTNANLSTMLNVNVGGALSVMKTAFFTGQVSTQSNLTVGGALSVMSSFYTYGDVVLNSSLSVRSDISTLSNVYIASTLSVGGDLVVYGDVSFNTKLLNLSNVSIARDLFVNNTISTHSSIVAGQFLRIMGSTFLMGHVSTLSNIDVGGGISTMKDLAVTGVGYFASNLVVQSSFSTVGHMNVFGFISTLSSVNIGHSLEVNRNLLVRSSLNVLGSTVLQSSVYIIGSLSVFSSIAISCNLDVGNFLTVKNMGSEILKTSTFSVVQQSNFVMNISSSTLHYGLFSTFGAINAGGPISTMNTLAVGSTIDTQFINVRQNLSTIGDVGVGSNLFVLSNIQSGASTIVDGGFYTNRQALFKDSVEMKSLTITSGGAEIYGPTNIWGETVVENKLTSKGGLVVLNTVFGGAGIVGIGKTAPVCALDVVGTVEISEDFLCRRHGVFGGNGVGSLTVGCNGGGSIIANGTVYVNKSLLYTDINSTNLSDKCQIQLNNQTGRLYIGNVYTAGVGTASIIQSSDFFGNIDHIDHGTSLLLNPLGGNVGVGVKNPTAKFQVIGNTNTTIVGEFATITNPGENLNTIMSALDYLTYNVDANVMIEIGSANAAVGNHNTVYKYLMGVSFTGAGSDGNFIIQAGGVGATFTTYTLETILKLNRNQIAIGSNAGKTSQGANTIAIGSAAGKTTQGTNSVAIGNQAGQSGQLANAIAIGVNAGNSGQLAKAVAIGESAGQTTQGTNSVAIGANAGQTGQLENAVAIGVNAGQTGQQGNAIAIGVNAGNATQGQNAIAMGSSAGVNQLMNAVAIGNEAGRTNQLENAVAIGNEAGKTNQKANAIAIGSKAGNTTQGTNTIAIGEFAGETSQEASAIAIGNQAGSTTQRENTIAIGAFTGKSNQGKNSIAIGFKAGEFDQIANSIIINASGVALNNTTSSGLFMKPIATSAGTTNLLRYDTGTSEITYTTTSLTPPGINTAGNIGINKAAGAVALDVNGDITATHDIMCGRNASFGTNGTGLLSIGDSIVQNGTLQVYGRAGIGLAINIHPTYALDVSGSINFTGVINSNGAPLNIIPSYGDKIAIGLNAGKTGQLANTIAIGVNAGQTIQGTNSVAIGNQAGQNSQKPSAIAIGESAGQTTQGIGSVAIGNQAGQSGQLANAIAIGVNAGNSGQLANAVAIGESAGQTTQGIGSVAIGANAGQTGQLQYAVAIGINAGKTDQKANAIAIGYFAGNTTQGRTAVAIGEFAGEKSQGTNSIAIGSKAGEINQIANSIIINASGVALNNTTSGLFMKPIATSAGTTNLLRYDTGTSEITYTTTSLTTPGINTSGNIGINKAAGTAAALDVNGNVSVNGSIKSFRNGSSDPWHTGTGENYDNIVLRSTYGMGDPSGNPLGITSILFGSAITTANYARIYAKDEVAGGNGWAGSLTFQTANNGELKNRMTIDMAGNVGIGVTAPQFPLHVATDIYCGTNATFAGNGAGRVTIGTTHPIYGYIAHLAVNGTVAVTAKSDTDNALHIANGRLYTAQSVNICGNGSGANFTVGAPGGNSVTALHGNTTVNGTFNTAQSVNICGNGSGANFTVGAPGGNSVTALHGNTTVNGSILIGNNNVSQIGRLLYDGSFTYLNNSVQQSYQHIGNGILPYVKVGKYRLEASILVRQRLGRNGWDAIVIYFTGTNHNLPIGTPAVFSFSDNGLNSIGTNAMSFQASAILEGGDGWSIRIANHGVYMIEGQTDDTWDLKINAVAYHIE